MVSGSSAYRVSAQQQQGALAMLLSLVLSAQAPPGTASGRCLPMAQKPCCVGILCASGARWARRRAALLGNRGHPPFRYPVLGGLQDLRSVWLTAAGVWAPDPRSPDQPDPRSALPPLATGETRLRYALRVRASKRKNSIAARIRPQGTRRAPGCDPLSASPIARDASARRPRLHSPEETQCRPCSKKLGVVSWLA